MIHHIYQGQHNTEIQEGNGVVVDAPCFFEFSTYHNSDIWKKERYQYDDIIDHGGSVLKNIFTAHIIVRKE